MNSSKGGMNELSCKIVIVLPAAWLARGAKAAPAAPTASLRRSRRDAVFIVLFLPGDRMRLSTAPLIRCVISHATSVGCNSKAIAPAVARRSLSHFRELPPRAYGRDLGLIGTLSISRVRPS